MRNSIVSQWLLMLLCMCWSYKLQGGDAEQPSGQGAAVQSGRRQKKGPGGEAPDNKPGAAPPPPPPGMPDSPMAMEVKSSEIREKTTRTMPPRKHRVEGCDNLAYYCFKAYTTGRICARTVENSYQFYKYYTFNTTCEMDYMNCNEGLDVWQIAHMGACMTNAPHAHNSMFEYYEYGDDLFMDEAYVIRE